MLLRRQYDARAKVSDGIPYEMRPPAPKRLWKGRFGGLLVEKRLSGAAAHRGLPPPPVGASFKKLTFSRPGG